MKEYLQKNKISIYGLAKKTGIPYSTLNYIINGKIKAEVCSAGNLHRIASCLGISMDEVYSLLSEEEV